MLFGLHSGGTVVEDPVAHQDTACGHDHDHEKGHLVQEERSMVQTDVLDRSDDQVDKEEQPVDGVGLALASLVGVLGYSNARDQHDGSGEVDKKAAVDDAKAVHHRFQLDHFILLVKTPKQFVDVIAALNSLPL